MLEHMYERSAAATSQLHRQAMVAVADKRFRCSQPQKLHTFRHRGTQRASGPRKVVQEDYVVHRQWQELSHSHPCSDILLLPLRSTPCRLHKAVGPVSVVDAPPSSAGGVLGGFLSSSLALRGTGSLPCLFSNVMTVRSSSHHPTRLVAEPAVAPKPPSFPPQSKPVDIPRGRNVPWHVAVPVPAPRRPHHIVEPRLKRLSVLLHLRL
eukprot:g68771.t1